MADKWCASLPSRSERILQRRVSSTLVTCTMRVILRPSEILLCPDQQCRTCYYLDIRPPSHPIWDTRWTSFHLDLPFGILGRHSSSHLRGGIMQESRPPSKLATTEQKRDIPCCLILYSRSPCRSTTSTMPSPKSESGRRFTPPAWPILRYLSNEHRTSVPPPRRLLTLSVAPIIAARSCIPVRP